MDKENRISGSRPSGAPQPSEKLDAKGKFGKTALNAKQWEVTKGDLKKGAIQKKNLPAVTLPSVRPSLIDRKPLAAESPGGKAAWKPASKSELPEEVDLNVEIGGARVGGETNVNQTRWENPKLNELDNLISQQKTSNDIQNVLNDPKLLDSLSNEDRLLVGFYKDIQLAKQTNIDEPARAKLLQDYTQLSNLGNIKDARLLMNDILATFKTLPRSPQE